MNQQPTTNSIYPPSVRFIRFLFPLLERFMPSVASNLAIRLFLTPVRFPYKAEEQALLETYTTHHGMIEGERFNYYSKGEGPAIICLHGWSGRGMQFRTMAAYLIDQGYKVVLIDAPGHGKSEGKRSTLFRFAQAFEEVYSHTNNVQAVIGHSLGAAAISYSLSRGFKAPALVVIGAPVIAEEILNTFSTTINASTFAHDAIRKAAVEAFDQAFDDVAMQSTFKDLTVPVYSLHGEKDQDVSLAHQDYLITLRPALDIKRYPHLGHRNILKDQEVFKDVTHWIKQLD